MGTKFNHISLEEREKVYCLKEQGKSFRDIAKELGRDHRSWSREYKKNRHRETWEYIPCKANAKSEKRKKAQRTKAPLKRTKVLVYVRDHLKSPYFWTPEQISIRIRIDINETICTQTIYNYIYGKGRSYKLYELLPQRHVKVRKRNNVKYRKACIDHRVFINTRPKCINKRKQLGHWETDLMEGSRKYHGVVQANVERKCRLIVGYKLKSKHSLPAITKIKTLSKQYYTLSVTSDNGTENSLHRESNLPWYFCNPYHSWEKGTVENTIGRMRRFIPKGSDMSKLKQKDIDYIINIMNNTPRKCLRGYTPLEMYLKEYGKIKSSTSGAFQLRM